MISATIAVFLMMNFIVLMVVDVFKLFYIKEYLKRGKEFIIVLYDQNTIQVARCRIGELKRFLHKKSGN